MFFQHHEGAPDLVNPNTRINNLFCKELAIATVEQGMDIAKAWPWELSLPLFFTSSSMVLKTVTFMIGESEWQTLRLKPPCLDYTCCIWSLEGEALIYNASLMILHWRSQFLALFQQQCLNFVWLVLGSCTFKYMFWGLQLIVITCMKGKWPPSTTKCIHLLQPDSSISLLHFYMDKKNKKINIPFSNLIKTV